MCRYISETVKDRQIVRGTANIMSYMLYQMVPLTMALLDLEGNLCYFKYFYTMKHKKWHPSIFAITLSYHIVF